ncbi:hypothetical protein [Enterococcus mundtii]|uniref:hypothetical protein n=1 Tax=Enterococcus TaxID=1350 RepID=UPI001CCEB435|nr:hypothetical protein [Enterococcus mundtii]UBM05802.1 hypothetical protein K9N66_01120 [Enterococcus mundtii]
MRKGKANLGFLGLLGILGFLGYLPNLSGLFSLFALFSLFGFFLDNKKWGRFERFFYERKSFNQKYLTENYNFFTIISIYSNYKTGRVTSVRHYIY